MCKKLKLAGQAILSMGYYKNESARSGTYTPGHEDAVADVLIENGFNKFKQEDFPNLRKRHIKAWYTNGFDNSLDNILIDMPNCSFILQPGGTQSFPDILVKDGKGKLFALECKSGHGTHPMWNDSTPKPGAVYIMSSGRLNQTTMFLGEDVFTAEEANVIEKYNLLFEELKAQCKIELDSVPNKNRGWLYSHRKQFFQQGGGDKTNYFTHKDRNECEKRVMKFLS